ncbi:BMC domain-containing protein [Robertmurraya andreesenii]|uniref:Microcompartment protein CcmL/EutN n=1 Tax=Anoxybacillus andreesenii TaxID=1325932 RepID=A0ABT9V7D3_9BACL|nr:BMC domain-containing protein [Robertmurraya andreesenii]MDQ0156866.1 microcompartment protein CcmL/EutN [Robertmurraya andreesenii]
MKKYEALGVVETQYFTIAMELLDQMCKSSDVEFLASENYLGGRLVTLIIGGSVSDVTVAVDVAKQVAETKANQPLKMALVINNPHAEIMKYIISSQPQSEVEEGKLNSIEMETKEESKSKKKKSKKAVKNQ